MFKLFAFDPGARTGWAVFRDTLLTEAGVLDAKKSFPTFMSNDAIVVIENPQIYSRSRADPNDILKVARIVGRLEERCWGGQIRLVAPRDWKGTIDGDIMVNRIFAGLSPLERAVLDKYDGGYRHNAIDAIGLGKWALRQPWARIPAAARSSTK